MKKDKSREDQSSAGTKGVRVLDAPLAYEQLFKKFNQPPRGKMPKELESIFLPEPEPYKLQEIKADRKVKLKVEPTVPMIPEWFGVSPLPDKAQLPVIPRISNKRGEANPLTMFSPEDRRIYNDISYPWGTICRVVTAVGAGSGVIVGPRHVVTASHVVDWSGNTGGTVEVHRSGATVRASTSITKIWYYTKVTGTVGWFELHLSALAICLAGWAPAPITATGTMSRTGGTSDIREVSGLVFAQLTSEMQNSMNHGMTWDQRGL